MVFGSLARNELTAGSDIDWILLVDGIADPEHLEASVEIETYLKEEAFRGPGAEATFGGLVFSHDLIHYNRRDSLRSRADDTSGRLRKTIP